MNLNSICITDVLCLYRALSTSTSEGYTGTFLLHHPHYDTEKYLERDKSFRDKCCLAENKFGLYCDKFFQRRLPNDCQDYSSMGLGM